MIAQKDPICYNNGMMKITEDTVQAERERVINLLKGPQFDREQHGSLYDRGSADSYYRRSADPHWWPKGTSNGTKVTVLTDGEKAEYMAGYEQNERFGDKKDWS